MSDHQVDGGNCLKCNAPMTGASNADGETAGPDPGDVTVCLYCGHMMEFGPDLKLIEPRDETIIAYAGHPALLHAQRISALWRADNATTEADEAGKQSR